MTPKNARDTANGRMYTWKGEEFYSVTTMLQSVPKQRVFTAWAAKLVAEGAVEAFRNGTLAALVAEDPEDAVRHLKGMPNKKRERAANAGTTIHSWVEAHILGAEPPIVPIHLRPQLEQFRAFEEKYKPRYLAAEATVYNRRERYAGTLDIIAEIDGRIGLIDTKSGGLYAEAAMQLAAYRNAEYIGGPDGVEHPLPKVDFTAVLHIQPESFRLVEVLSTDEVFYAFRVAREMFRWETDLSKRVLMDTVAFPGENRVDTAVRLFGDAE